MLEDDHGENSFRQGDSNYEKSLKQPYESKSTANVYDNQEITSNGFDDCRMRIEEILSQTDHQEGIDDNKVWFTNISLHLFLRIKGDSAAS